MRQEILPPEKNDNGHLFHKKWLSPYLILVVLFVLSVALRTPHLNRPLSDSHEWVTATSMISIENLIDQGAWKHHFCILMTYPREADKWVDNLGFHMLGTNGQGYYTSFPPFSIIFAFFFLS